MFAYEIIKKFSVRTVLPVDVNDVLNYVITSGIQDEIEFIGVDLNPDVLLGQFKRFRRRDGVYSDPINCANIYYARSVTSDWKRFICCKELLHIADPQIAQASTPESVLRLAEKIGLPPGLQDAPNDGLQTNMDRLAEYMAVAILFPSAARSALIHSYNSGKLSLDDIARMADIPIRYAGFVMNEIWEKILPLLTKDE
jgi:hypothetical protein